MPIDNCEYTFKQLANTRFPNLMNQMYSSIEKAYPLNEFIVKGYGKKAFLKKVGKEKDFQGCYVFIEKGKPLYVGISQNVINRISQHINGRTHSEASWAFRIALSKYKSTHKSNIELKMRELNKNKITSVEYMNMPDFHEHFKEAKRKISNMKCAFIEIENPLELYLFEVYCCMELDTNIWNTFKTH